MLIQTEFQHLLKPVPTAGIGDTKPWYEEYQALVRRIPTAGTDNTKPWYKQYRPVVRKVPSVGTGVFPRHLFQRISVKSEQLRREIPLPRIRQQGNYHLVCKFGTFCQ